MSGVYKRVKIQFFRQIAYLFIAIGGVFASKLFLPIKNKANNV